MPENLIPTSPTNNINPNSITVQNNFNLMFNNVDPNINTNINNNNIDIGNTSISIGNNPIKNNSNPSIVKSDQFSYNSTNYNT